MARITYRNGEEVEIKYNLYGKYIPAMYDTPAEYPDVLIEAVYYKEVNILPILSYGDQEEINELLIDYLYG